MAADNRSSLRAALEPSALRAALVPRRPVFANPWDSTPDMFACYVAVSFIDPLLLWGGGALMGSIFGHSGDYRNGLLALSVMAAIVLLLASTVRRQPTVRAA